MSHVAEGALHAYLDGALDEFPAAEARRIRTHLDRCHVCRSALEEARALREEAGRVLESAPTSVALPTLEEMRRLAGTGVPETSSPPRRRLRLAWAASLVLAVGAGWVLRGQDTPNFAFRSGAEDGAVERGGPGASGAAGVAATAERERPTLAANGGGAPIPVEPDPVPAPDLPADPLLAELETVPAAPLGDRVTPPLPAPGALSRMRVAARTELRSGDDAVRGPATVDAADREEPPAGSELGDSAQGLRVTTGSRGERGVLARRNESAPGLAIPGGVSPELDRGRDEFVTAGGDAPGSLVVPGLEVLSIVWREEGVTPAGVRVLQRLESGDTLELIHLPEEIAPESLSLDADGSTTLAAERPGQGWVVLRAPLDREALQALLVRLEALAP